MSQKEKPKRGDLSPDELLQKARLLYRKNEAFLQGKSKELHPKETIFAHIRLEKYGFIISENSYSTSRTEWIPTFGFWTCYAIVLSMFYMAISIIVMSFFLELANINLLDGINSDERTKILSIIVGTIIIIPIVVFILVPFTGALLRFLRSIFTFSKIRLHHDYTDLIQQGKLYLGEYRHGRKNNVRFYLPDEDKVQTINYSNLSTNRLLNGDKVIVLYLNESIFAIL